MNVTTTTACPVCENADLTLHCEAYPPEPETNSGAYVGVIDIESECGCVESPCHPGLDDLAWDALADEPEPEPDPDREDPFAWDPPENFYHA